MILNVEHNIIHLFPLRLPLMNAFFINEFNQVLAMAFEHGLEGSSLHNIIYIIGVETCWSCRLSI